MSRFSSTITPKKLNLVAYPSKNQIVNLQIKLPAMLEYLYVINASFNSDDLQNKQGGFTKDKYELLQQEDKSFTIKSDCDELHWNICAFLNANEIDFKPTEVSG